MGVGENGNSVVSEHEYKRRIRAWTMYDWANSAFATTILAAVLPAYYSGVAGATLPSAAVATAYWTTTLSISLIIVAILSPILGTIADVMRGKKKMLSIFVGIGVVGTGLLVVISTGDWMLASVFFIIGRVGFAGANVFYDSLLPHVARPEDQDSVSARGLCHRVPGRRPAARRQRRHDLLHRLGDGSSPLLRHRGHLVGGLLDPDLPPGTGATLGYQGPAPRPIRDDGQLRPAG